MILEIPFPGWNTYAAIIIHHQFFRHGGHSCVQELLKGRLILFLYVIISSPQKYDGKISLHAHFKGDEMTSSKFGNVSRFSFEDTSRESLMKNIFHCKGGPKEMNTCIDSVKIPSTTFNSVQGHVEGPKR